MSEREIHVERLLGSTVVGVDGKRIGRLQEIAVETRGGECLVTEYLVGAYGLFERLAASEIARAILRSVGVGRRQAGYRVPWHALDVTDPASPRLTCAVETLPPIVKDSPR